MPKNPPSLWRSLGLGFVLGALGVLAVQGFGGSGHGVVPSAQAAQAR
jgi:hypothetical protein